MVGLSIAEPIKDREERVSRFAAAGVEDTPEGKFTEPNRSV
jgi:hypothetical protein